MKRLTYILTLTLVLVACGSRSGYFSLEGRLLNLNQGEFYVYSPDGVFEGFDTIKVEGGRFTFETPCKESGTIMIVFPNFSEQPVFAEPGKSVTIKGNASHLKEIEIEGTKENKLMNGFRQQTAKASPPEVMKYAEQFIRNNPKSPASIYILRKYFILPGPDGKQPDINKAEELVSILHKEHPKNGQIARMARYISSMKRCVTGSALQPFATQDVYGNSITDAQLKGRVAIVFTWANWSYESRNMRNKLLELQEEYGNRLAVMGINLDASRTNCKNFVQRDSTKAITVCDQKMFESPLIEQFALHGIARNVLFNAQGRVLERDLSPDEIKSKLKILLN